MSEREVIDDAGLDILFRTARSYSYFLDKDVPEDKIRALYDLTKMGATSMNTNPMRVLFLCSDTARARVYPYLAQGNLDKVRSAPVVAVVAYDLDFADQLPKLMPYTDARAHFVGKDDYIRDTAYRNSTLQGAYLMMAVRALGLDCCAMSGFDADGVKAEFFPDKNWEVNFLCNIGYGDKDRQPPRLPRPDFDDVCEVL